MRIPLLLVVATNALLLSAVPAAEAKKEDPKFRMEKINFVWSKAAHHLKDEAVASKLQKDLAVFDGLYLSIKQDAEHHKKTKSLAEVDTKLEALLRRYDLENALHAFKLKYKHDSDKAHAERTPSDQPKGEFVDERVRDLWTKVKEDADLDADDLEEFHRQLVRQDNRCLDYEERLQQQKQTTDNHVHPHEEYEENARRVKELNREIEEKFEELRERLVEIRENPFKNRKTRQLWDKARRSGRRLIPNELKAIKAELRHLDRQWDKVEHYQEHLGEHEEALKSMGHDGGDEHTNQLRDHHEKLQRKLKKLEAYLEEKITSHSEL